MDTKKKKYIRPAMEVYKMHSAAPILAGSDPESLPSELVPPEIAPFL